MNTEAAIAGSTSDLETRIDEPEFKRAGEANIDDVVNAVLSTQPIAILHNQATNLETDHVFLVPQSEAVVVCGRPDLAGLEKAAAASVSLAKTGSLDPLRISVSGHSILLSRFAPHQAGELAPLLPDEIYAAGYNHAEEWPRYRSIFGLIDHSAANPETPVSANTPEFFSSDLQSLGDSLPRLRSASIITQNDGEIVRDTVRLRAGREVTRRSLFALALAPLETAALSWIEIDLRLGARKPRWPNPGLPISFGSLLKPFLTLSYGATHNNFPVLTCHGSRDDCWLAHGHGRQDIVNALANSCNAYFLSLAANLDRAALDSVCLSYGLSRPNRSASPASLIGKGTGWTQLPMVVAEAFALLINNRSGTNVGVVLKAMAQCAAVGTAKEIHLAAYAKTGTAPCSHTPRAPGDGFVAAIYRIAQPRTVVLVRHHGTTGAETARDVRSILPA